MKVKDSTVIIPDNEYIQRIQHVVDKVWQGVGLPEATCTSGQDGQHGPNSYHAKGRALDIRFWDILELVAQRIRVLLPRYYDVVVEKDHFHIEADAVKERSVVEGVLKPGAARSSET